MRGRYALVLAAALLCLVTALAAQEYGWLWANRAGGGNDDYGRSIITDDQGYIYVTGSYKRTADFGSIIHTSYSSASSDLFVAKLDTDGNWLWVASAGGYGNDSAACAAVDSEGNVYVTGSFSAVPVQDTAFFGDIVLTSAGDGDIFVAKLSSGGSWLWATRAGGAWSDGASGIALDEDGNCYVTGFFADVADFGSTILTGAGDPNYWDVFVAKLDAGGNWLWAVNAAGDLHDEGRAIALDNAGNPCVAGLFRNQLSIGSQTLISSAEADVFVAKLDSLGNWLWAERAGGGGLDTAYGLTIDSQNNICVTGHYRGTAYFGATQLQTSSSSYGDVFVAKLDSLGNWLWARRAGYPGSANDGGYDVITDADDNILLCGYCVGGADFGPITIGYVGSPVPFAAMLSPGGAWLWAEVVPGDPSVYGSDGYANGIALDHAGNLFLTGYFDNTLLFGSISLTSLPHYFYSMASIDVFISKYGELPIIPAVPANLQAAVFGDDILLEWDYVDQDIYGNPYTPDLYYVYVSDSPDGEYLYLGHSGSNLYLDIWAAALYDRSYYKVTAVKFDED